MDFIENFDLNINKTMVDSIQGVNTEFRNIVRKQSQNTLKNLKETNKDINNSLKESQKQIVSTIRNAEKEINTTLGQIQDPSTLINTTIRAGQRGFRANVMNPMSTFKGKFINTLNSGYREKIVKPLAIIDRGARRGIVNSDVATRQLLRQIKNPNDIALKKYVLRPLSEVQNKATRAVKRAVIDGIILPVNYADRAIKQTLIDTDSQIKIGLKQLSSSGPSLDVQARSFLAPINRQIDDTETSVLTTAYGALKDYSIAYDSTYLSIFNILIKPFTTGIVYKGESFVYMLAWSFFLILATISQFIYDATIGNLFSIISYLTGFDLSGKAISKNDENKDVPFSIFGTLSKAGKDIWMKNSIVKKVKNIVYKFFLIIASVFDLITLAFINNATFFTDLVKALFGSPPTP
jgi:hypothetical protein